MLRDCFFEFAVDLWFGCRTTESGFAGDIGTIEMWLIDYQIIYIVGLFIVSQCTWLISIFTGSPKLIVTHAFHLNSKLWKKAVLLLVISPPLHSFQGLSHVFTCHTQYCCKHVVIISRFSHALIYCTWHEWLKPCSKLCTVSYGRKIWWSKCGYAGLTTKAIDENV